MLGPLLVRADGGEVVLRAAKQRALLAVLLLEARRDVVPTGRFIDDLWGDEPPANAEKALQMHVSKVRRAIAPAQLIVTRPTGYAMDVDPDAVDIHRFEALLSRARRLRDAEDRTGALVALRAALDLWRGPALTDVDLLGPGAAEPARLEEMRAVAHEERMELELEAANARALVPELQSLVADNPYRERMHRLLMLALYRAGRQADALAAFQRARKLLVEDLGLEPGPELARLQDAILAHDESLELPEATEQPHAESSQVDRPHVARSARAAARGAATPILGREAELDAALQLIAREDVRILTITGPGGIGKTRLAVELAARVGDRSRLVELAATRDPARVLPSIASVIEAEDGSEEAVAEALQGDAVVLFLDNFEQVLGAAGVVASLLGMVQSLTIVVTSRAPLRIMGEHELPLPPLPHRAASELFVQRAQAQNAGFVPDAADMDCIERICERIDGLPLAIELAAARSRMLGPEQILQRIGHRLDLLTAGRRDAPERHRTLRGTIAWSYDLLSADEQRLFAQMAVFPSGWSLEAAEAVADGDVLEAMSGLVDHYLVVRDGRRLRMLETVREYAAERLQASAEADALRRRHARWCLDLAEAAEEELEGPKQEAWFARLDAEQENIRAAAAWGLENGEPEIALGLDGRLWRYWLARGATTEAREALTAALASGVGDARLRATGLNAAGVLAGESGDVTAARAAFEESLDLATQLPDSRLMAKALANLGMTAMFTKDYTTALTRYGEAGEIWHALGDLRGRSIINQNLAVVHELMGDLDSALPLLEESVELARAAGDRMQVAGTVITLAHLLSIQGVEDARIPALLREGFALATALGERLHIVECLEVTAGFAARTGDPTTGGELIGAADADRERTGAHRKPDEVPFFEATIRELEASLGRDEFVRARARGSRLELEAAVAAALAVAERSRPMP